MSADLGLLEKLTWCRHQAEEIMSITAGCASTHGDPGGGLEWANSLASDIAINLEMIASDASCLASLNSVEVVEAGLHGQGDQR